MKSLREHNIQSNFEQGSRLDLILLYLYCMANTDTVSVILPICQLVFSFTLRILSW